MARGNKAKLLIREQADFDTAEATGQTGKFHAMRYYNHTPAPALERLSEELLDGAGGALPREVFDGLESGSFSVEVPAGVNSIGHWLKMFKGAPSTTDLTGGDYRHDYDALADPVIPEFSVGLEYTDIGLYMLGTSVQFNSLNISARKTSERLKFRFDGACHSWAKAAASFDSAPLSYAAASDPIPQAWKARIERDDTLITDTVVGLDLTIANGVELDNETLNSTQYPAGRLDAQWAITGTLEMLLNDATYIDLAEAGTRWKLGLNHNVQAGAPGAQRVLLDIDNIVLGKFGTPVQNDGRIRVSVPFQAGAPSGSWASRFRIHNQTANYDRP